MKRIEKKQILLMIFSFFIAVFIWATVMDQKNPEKEYEIRSIPIKLNEGEVGPRSAGLTIIKGQNQTVTVRIKGMRNDIASIDESRITATVDVSDVIVAGNYNLPIDVSLNHVGITMVDVQPTHLNLTVDKMISRTIPITVNSTGEVNGDFVLNNIVSNPSSVTVTGPKSEVDVIKSARIDLKMSDVKKDYTEKQRIILIGGDGTELKTQYTTKNIEGAEVAVSVFPIKKVAIEVAEKNKLPDTVEFSGYAIDPQTVDIVGDAAALDAITSVKTEPVDLSLVTKSTDLYPKLALPAGVKIRDEKFSCKVTVNVLQREVRLVKIHRYEVANVAVGNTVKYEPLELEITLLGTPENLNQLDIGQITAVIDLKSTYYTPGTAMKCPLTIRLPAGAKAAVSGNYTIDITIGT